MPPLLLLLIAQPTCEESYVEAQRAQRDGRLLEARTDLVRCAQRECPKTAQTDCAQWLIQVEARLPSIVVRVKDVEGLDVADAKLYLDDLQVENDGRILELDPGAHELFVEAPGYRNQRLPLTIAEGEKQRSVELLLVRVVLPAPTVETTVASAPPFWIYIAGGVGVLALSSFAYFGITSTRDFQKLQDECGPNCAEPEVASVHRKQIVADVSLGVGILGIGSSIVGLLVHLYEPRVMLIVNRESADHGTDGFIMSVSMPWF